MSDFLIDINNLIELGYDENFVFSLSLEEVRDLIDKER